MVELEKSVVLCIRAILAFFFDDMLGLIELGYYSLESLITVQLQFLKTPTHLLCIFFPTSNALFLFYYQSGTTDYAKRCCLYVLMS